MKPFNVKTTVKSTPIVPSGVTSFVIYGIWHVGLVSWSPKSLDKTDTVILGFEFPGLPPLEFKEDDGSITRKPRVLTAKFNNSMSPKSRFRKTLEGWRGTTMDEEALKNFKIASLVGKSGLANIIHKVVGDKTYAEIGALMQGPKVQGTLKQELFSVLSLENANELKGCHLYPWIEKMVEGSDDYQELLRTGTQRQEDPEESHPTDTQASEAEADSEIPF